MVNTEKKQERKGETIHEQSNLNAQLQNIKFEDHFLMFRRAGNHAPYLQKVIDYTNGKTVEFGCGTGTQALAVEPYVDSAIGVELDPDRIKLTYERACRMNAASHFLRGDMFDLPFADNAVSTAFNSGVFQHFDDEGITKIVNEAARIASDYLILSVANNAFPKDPNNESRRMKSHDWWCDCLEDCSSSLSLVDAGQYGDRLNTGYRAVTLRRPIWAVQWLLNGLPYPRSWFVLEIDG